MKPDVRDPNSPTISVDEAADLLRCGVRSVQELVDTGELPALELNQRHTVLLREDVIEYVRTQARKQATERKLMHARRKAKPPVAIASTPEPGGRGRRRKALPDLRSYELTTGAQPA